MGKTPTAVIFDMDDVLCRYHFDKRLARLSEMTGVAAEVIDEVIWKQGFDEEADAQLVAAVEAIQEKGSVALEASGAISDDGIIDPRDTRTVLGICLSVVRNKPIEGATGYGVFRL